jgi:hypothetical protein
MIVELFAIKCFSLGVFITWMIMRNMNKKCKTYEIKEV